MGKGVVVLDLFMYVKPPGFVHTTQCHAYEDSTLVCKDSTSIYALICTYNTSTVVCKDSTCTICTVHGHAFVHEDNM